MDSSLKKKRPDPKPYTLDDPIIQAKFWSKVEVPRMRLEQEKCWEWRQGLDRHGYGQFTPSSCASPLRSHRVAWRLFNGPIPDGMQVLHSCDNPRCCNPAHLWLGTNTDNMRDMAEKGRAAGGRNARKRAEERRTVMSRIEQMVKAPHARTELNRLRDRLRELGRKRSNPLPGDHP